jgi:hypothetical protein
MPLEPDSCGVAPPQWLQACCAEAEGAYAPLPHTVPDTSRSLPDMCVATVLGDGGHEAPRS